MSQTHTWKLPLLILLAASAFPGGQVFAQQVQIETEQRAREQNRTTTAPQTVTDEEVSDPELGDIAIVSRAPRPKMFSFWTGQTLNYTSNAFLTRDNERDTIYWNGRAGASVTPFSTRDFTPRLIFEQNWFRYDKFSELDFDSQNLQLDLKYDLNADDSWFVSGSYAVARLYTQQGTIGEFYRYGLANASITHFRQLSGPFYLGVTGGTYWRHGDPSSSDRVSAYLNAVALYSLHETVRLSAFARPEFQHYTHDPSGTSREDFNLLLGATISWNPQEYLSIGATAVYVGNFSDVSERRYDVVTPSLLVGAQIAF